MVFPGSFKKPSATNPTHLASDLASTQISKKTDGTVVAAMFAHPRVPVLSKSVSVSLQLSYFPVSDGGDIHIPQTKRPAEYGRVSPFVDKK